MQGKWGGVEGRRKLAKSSKKLIAECNSWGPEEFPGISARRGSQASVGGVSRPELVTIEEGSVVEQQTVGLSAVESHLGVLPPSLSKAMISMGPKYWIQAKRIALRRSYSVFVGICAETA